MIVVDASIVNIALPHAQQALHITTANRQWVITAYTLTFGGLLLLGGRIADYVGRKRVLLVGPARLRRGVGASAAWPPTPACSSPPGPCRAAFAALMAPAALSLLTVTFTEPRERARAFGVWGAIAGGGLAIGLILGGVLTQYASWRWCLLVNTPIALLAAFAAFRLIPESRVTGHTRYDIPGALTSTLGMVTLVYGVTKASTDGWGSAAHPRAAGAGRRPAGGLRGHRALQQPSAAAAAGRHGAQPGRLLPDDPAGRAGHVRDLPVPHLLPAGDPALLGPEDRVRLPAVLGRSGRRGHGLAAS